MQLERALALLFGTATLLLAGCSPGSPGVGGVKKESAADKREEAARTRTDLGQKYMQQGKLEIALEDLNKALEYDADYVDAHTVIAVLYEKINDLPNAELHYKRAAQLKPKGGSELNNYGTFLCKLGRYDEAQGYFERAVADPFYQTPAVALTNSGTCLLKAGRTDEAEKVLRLALEKRPDDAEAMMQLATALYDRGDYFRARAFVQRFEATAAPRAETLLLGRNIELKLGNASGASDYTKRLLQAFPQSPQARALAGQGQS